MKTVVYPLKVFISYSHKDKEWKEKLLPHLNSLIRQKYIELWYDNIILPGNEIDEEVLRSLKKSQIVLLLVSADYLSSKYCYEIEMETAMKMREEGETKVIPILLRPVDLKGTPFDGLKSLPEDRKAISLFLNEDAAYEDVAKGIRQVAEAWYKESRTKKGNEREEGGSGTKEENPVKIESAIDLSNKGVQILGSTLNGNIIFNNNK